MNAKEQRNELQRILRKEFDEANNDIASDILELSHNIIINGYPLEEEFINDLMNDLL